MEALMPRLFGALAALCLLTACPPIDPVWVTTDAIPAPVPADPSDSESSTGATPTTSGGTDGVAPDESTSSAVPTSSHADDSTGTGSTSSGDLPQPDACAPARLIWEAPTKEGLRKAGERTERLWRVLGWSQEWDAHLERPAA